MNLSSLIKYDGLSHTVLATVHWYLDFPCCGKCSVASCDAAGSATRTGGDRERTYVPRYLCSPVPMFPEPMFPGTYVPRYLCSPVPMFPGFCTLIVVISINRLEILHTPWYDSRLGLWLGFRFRVLVRVRVRVRLELQTVFRLWLGCGLGLSIYG